MNTRTAIAVTAAAWTLGASLALGFSATPAHADVNLSSLPPSLPTCVEEDGSGGTTLPCIWTDPDTSNAYLTYADHSELIVDDTVQWPVAHGVAAADGATPGPGN